MAGPKAAQRGAATDLATGLDTADLDAALMAGEADFEAGERADAAALAAAIGDHVDAEPTSGLEQVMVDAAMGQPVRAALVLDYSERASQRPRDVRGPRQTWDGIPTRFVLGFPLNAAVGVLLAEGEPVEFNVNPVLSFDGQPTGEFVGTGGPDDESGSCMNLYKLGMFQHTRPYRVRLGRQASIDQERGVWEEHIIGANADGSPIIQEPMLSLAQPDYEQMMQILRRTRGIGSPDAMRAAEQMARRAGTEAAGSRTPVGAR